MEFSLFGKDEVRREKEIDVMKKSPNNFYLYKWEGTTHKAQCTTHKTDIKLIGRNFEKLKTQKWIKLQGAHFKSKI